jgi:hypothetical protein
MVTNPSVSKLKSKKKSVGKKVSSHILDSSKHVNVFTKSKVKGKAGTMYDFGYFNGIRSDLGKVYIETINGKRNFSYDKKQEDEIKKHLWNFIEVESSEKNLVTYKLKNETLIVDFSEGSPLKVIQPIPIVINQENENYIIDCDVFDLFSYSKDLMKARLDLEKQIYALWKNFVGSDIKLSESGLFRKKLLQNFMEEQNAA